MNKRNSTINDIAITGIAFQLPQANSLEQLADILDKGVDCTSELPEARRKDIPFNKARHSVKYPTGGYLSEIDKFDYRFFKLSPKEASLMDPHQRMFLQTAWHAFEDAGYTEKRLSGSNTGVFVGFKGSQGSEYLNYVSEIDEGLLSLATIGNKAAMMTGRLSYLYDLKGPNMLLDTTCSSSLVAVHQACTSLRNGECETALVGGVKLLANFKYSEEIGVNSKDGKTRSFDNEADGTGFGEGVIAILLKPLQGAIDDHDHIYAVIKGSAMNHGGTSIGLTAPNSNSQADVIEMAWKDAGINPESISYIEAHGTGTRLGDPIEIEGIKKAFGRYTKRENICAISTVKSNIGHLDSAAGLAGLLSCIAALKSKKLNPIVHFKKLNENIKLNHSSIYIVDKTEEWKVPSGSSRRCGLSSFGLSGTNCHIVMEEFIENEDEGSVSTKIEAEAIFTVSAKTRKGLQEYLQIYKSFLEASPEIQLNDLCFTTNTRRTHFQYRLAILIKNREELLTKLHLLMETGEDKYAGLTDENVYYGESKRQIKATNDPFASSKDICLKYSQGFEIKWEAFYADNVRPVPVPKYPFEKQRCWVTKSSVDMLYKMAWDRNPLVKFRSISKDNFLLISDCESFAEQFTAQHSIEHVNTIMMNEFEKVSDYDSLFGNVDINHVILALNIADDDSTDVMKCLLRLQQIVRTLIRKSSDALTIQLITANANVITGKEQVRPDNAALLGYGKVIAHEHRSIRTKLLDIDAETNMSQIYSEIINCNEDTMVSYRNGVRYIPYLEKMDTTVNYQEDVMSVNTLEKVYVISGGLGGIGLEVARYLARPQAKIILLGRTPFIKKEFWNRAAQDPSVEVSVKEKIRKLLEIEKTGATVEYLQADVTNERDLANKLTTIRDLYGPIKGIIHSAGVAGDGFIIAKTDEKLKQVLESKIIGTRNLDNLTSDDNLDFFILFSSATTLVGAAGQSDYTAANSFVDSYCAYRSSKGKPTKTINWSAWGEVGMAVDHQVNNNGKFLLLGTAEAVKAFDQILKLNIERVVVGEFNQNKFSADSSKTNLNTLYRESRLNYINSINKGIENVSIDESCNEVINEATLIAIWEELLGVQGITADSDFFELGGHSVLAVRLEVELETRNLISDNANIATVIYETSVLKELVEYINNI